MEIYSLVILGARRPKSRFWQGWLIFPNLPWLPTTLSAPRRELITPVSVPSSHGRLPSVCPVSSHGVLLSLGVSSPHSDASHAGLRAHSNPV